MMMMMSDDPIARPVPGFERLRRDAGETRTLERLRAHYELEVPLAQRLKNAPKAERPSTYKHVYDELFTRVHDHPQHVRKQVGTAYVDRQLRKLRPYLRHDCTFLEVGAGDCRLSFAVAERVGRVIALDVSDKVADIRHAPPNFSFELTDGTSIALPPESVDFAYSNQLMEHLHTDDAFEQLANIYRVLKPSGIYYCATPNRVSGPHDISRYFNHEARGLHLKEYSCRELNRVFREVGFARVEFRAGGLGPALPKPPLFAVESFLSLTPAGLRPFLCQSLVVRRLLGIHAFAHKPARGLAGRGE